MTFLAHLFEHWLFVARWRWQRRLALSGRDGDASGMHYHPAPARVEDREAAPHWIFVSMIESPAEQVRYHRLARSTFLDVV